MKNSLIKSLKGYLFLFSLIVLFNSNFSIQIFAEEGESSGGRSCNVEEVDFSSELGPVLDQQKEGLCWAFAASSVYRQALCQDNPLLCMNKNYSPSVLDGMSCANRKLNAFKVADGADKGGRPEWALNCMLGKGACSEEVASFSKWDDKLKKMCEAAPIHNDEDEGCYQLSFLNGGNMKKRGIYNVFQEGSPHTFGPREICDEATKINLTPVGKCLFKNLIPEMCKQNRVMLSNANSLKPETIRMSDKSNTRKENILNKIISERKAVALAVCLDHIEIPELQATLKNKASSASGEKCSNGHAVTIGGMKCLKGELYYYVHNSWGKDAPFHGWIKASLFLKYSMDVTYIGRR